jgi:HK97 family phage major capsid protein
MHRYHALLQERADLVAEGRAIFEAAEREGNRALTAQEQARDDEINARLGVLAGEIAREETRRERERLAPAAPPAAQPFGREAGTQGSADQHLATLLQGHGEPDWLRRVPGAAAPDARNRSGLPYLVPSAEGERPWGYDTGAPFGEFLQAVHRARTRGVVDPRLNAALGQQESVGADGGFLVQQQIFNQIQLNMFTGEILSRVRRIPLQDNSNGVKINVVDETSRVTGSRFGGVQGYWLDEAQAKIPSQTKFFRMTLELKKVAALMYSTDELLQDASALEAVMTTAMAEELRFLVEDAIVEGDGVGKPLGILAAAALVTTAAVSGQGAGTVVAANLSAMWGRLAPSSQQNAVWLVNTAVLPLLDTLFIPFGTGGGVQPTFISYSDTGVLRIKGRPVIPVEYAAAPGTAGDIILADLSQYAFIDRGGIKQDSSMHVAFTTDETCFRAVYRVDGAPMWRSALTPFKGSATLSPFVVLSGTRT